MKIAQFASRYQYDPELARGMYLYEHRRCFDNIIDTVIRSAITVSCCLKEGVKRAI